MQNVTLFNYAASRETGRAVMTVPQYPTGGENFYQASLVAEAGEATSLRRISVELRAVDSVLPVSVRPITFIKCDVEGHEADALAGAAGTIERDRPALCVEVTGDPDVVGSSSHRIVTWLATLGYQDYWFDAGHLVRRRPGDRSVNYFFLTASHLSRLAARRVISG
jgi:FkbM family methyltransferase